MSPPILEALLRLRRTAEKAVRRLTFGAPLLSAVLGGAAPAQAASSAYLNINVTIQAISPIQDLTALPGVSSGTIVLSWTEPYHSVGVAPYAYDVRASSVAQISDDVAFSTNSLLSTFSPSAIPAPGSGGGGAGFIVSGLTANVTYYFAIREKDSTIFHGSWQRTLFPSVNVDNYAIATAISPPPTGAVLRAVWISSLTASWNVLPGATNYMLVATTTTANPPLGVVASSKTASSTATLVGLTPNTSYFLYLAACANGCSSYGAFASTVTLAARAVSLVASSVTSSSVQLSWGANGNPTGTLYAVAQSTDGVVFSTVSVSTLTSTGVVGLTDATTYYFEIIAINRAGTWAPPSAAIMVVTPPAPPAAPGGGIITGVFISSLTATWSTVSGTTDYVLVASTSAALPPAIVASTTTLLSTGTLTGLAPNTTYFIFVAACHFDCSPYTALGSTQTLAAPAVGLSTTSISSSTVSLGWNPNGNPLGSPYNVLQSTDGVTFAIVATVNSPTANLTLLTGGVTYYFTVVALGGNGVPAAASNVLIVVMPTGPTPSTPSGMTATAGLLSVTLSWNALALGQQGVGLSQYLIQRSTNFAFGFAQIGATAATLYVDRPLPAGITFYYRLIAKAIDGAQSAPTAVVSATPYTLLPMEPLGVRAQASSTTVTISWSPTQRFYEGSPFLSTGTPTADELIGYSIYRSTNICDPNYLLISSLPVTTNLLSDNTGGLNYHYRLFSYNNAGISTNVVTISSLGQHDYLVDDCISDVVLDDELSRSLNGSYNGLGDIRIVRDRRPQDVTNGVYQSVEWRPFLNGVTELKNWSLPRPARIVLHYETLGGVPVPDSTTVAGILASGPAASANASDLGAYWYNGVQWLKMYGRIDTLSQTVSLDSPNLGTYQIRAQARSGGTVFDMSNLYSRVITPNGDGLNDMMIFKYDPGPKNVQPTGKIMDLQGGFVADMVPGADPTTLTWNGRMNGLPVRSGAYVYRITGDGKIFTGTIVVAR